MFPVQTREWETAVADPENTRVVVTRNMPPAAILLLCMENPRFEPGTVVLPAKVQPRVKPENSSLM